MSGKGKRPPATKKTSVAAAASQPSILSFFGRGNEAAPGSAAHKQKAQSSRAEAANLNTADSSGQEGNVRAAQATATAARTGKRRKQAKAGKKAETGVVADTATVDLAAATPGAAATTPAAAIAEKLRKSSRGTAINGHHEKTADSSPSPAVTHAESAVASTPNAEAVPGNTGALSPAYRGVDGGVCRGGDAGTPSPETDSETSPAGVAVLKRGHEEHGARRRGGKTRPTKRGRMAPTVSPPPREGGGVWQDAGGSDGSRVGDRVGAARGVEGEAEEERRKREDPQADKKGVDAAMLMSSVGRGGGGVREVGARVSDEAGEETDGEEKGEPDHSSSGGSHDDDESKQVNGDLDEGSEGKEQQRGNEDKAKEEEEEEEAGEEGEGQGEEGTGEDAEQEKADGQEEAAQGEPGGISQYELQRLERIKRNQAFMATLGLATAKPPTTAAAGSSSSRSGGGSGKRPSKKRSRPVSRASEKAPAVPVRRSARARGAEAVDYSEDKQAINAIAAAARAAAAEPPQPEPVLEEIDFDDSTVFKYLCEGGGRGDAEGTVDSSASATGSAPEGSRVVGLRKIELGRTPLSASGLSTIYTMHFCGAAAGASGGRAAAPPLLAAGGKGGIVALFSTQRQQQGRTTEEIDNDEGGEEGDARTLMNFKAHKGWVSAVRFLQGGGGSTEGCRLLSSANDGVVKLWDTSKQHRGSPRLLCTLDDFHPTRKGIFAMDSYGPRVATGSKDTTVAIASVRPTGLELDRVLGDTGGSQAFHEKVVKGVSLRDENTVASCGDDSNVRVCDLRSPSFFGVSHRLDGVHDGRPCHTVRWHPFDGNLLLSAGLDSTVKLHDLRRLASPLHVFRGHCPYALARPRAIHRPEFFLAGGGGGGGGGAVNIITCGEKSEKLSMYDASSGATISRGVLGDEASSLAVGDFSGGWKSASSEAGGIAAALPGGDVVLLEPVWGTD